MTKKKKLEACFMEAIDQGKKNVGFLVRMEGFEKDEIIINPSENFVKKMAYLHSVYDDHLEHKFSPGIFIVGHAYGDSFEEIEKQLIQ